MLKVLARSHRALRIAGLAAIAFGVASVAAGGSVLFGPPAVRAAAGHVVAFVLPFNFVAGFFYVACGIAILRNSPWAKHLALAIAVASAAVLVALGWHVNSGGAFELRTVLAMTLRVTFWAVVAGWTRRAHRALAAG
jgi:hypothetical protein